MTRTKTRPSLKRAIQWIADNDAVGDNDPIDTLSGLVSVCLVADMFGVDQKEVARRIWNIRNPNDQKGVYDDARLWVRVGDGSEYEEFGDDFSALADHLNEMRVGRVLGWQGMGFATDRYDGNNYVSLFWGDADAQPVANADLDADERAEVERRVLDIDAE
jgi:hypothetical protein